MSQRQDVVITGLGVVSPCGIGVDSFWDSLIHGKSGIGQLELYDMPNFVANFGGEIKDFEPKKYVKPRKSLKVMCREIQTGFAAASLAMEYAGLGPGDVEPERLGVVYGSEMFFTDFSDLRATYDMCIDQGIYHHDRWGEATAKEVNPLWMLNYLPNMPACHVGIYLDGRAHNNTLAIDSVSSIEAFSEGVSHIERGTADVMIVGGTGSKLSLCSMLFRGESLLSTRSEEPCKASRPFDADRDGLVNAEGSGAIVLESRQHAEARGAKILGKFTAYSGTWGTTNSEQPINQDAIERGIKQILAHSGLSAAEISHVNAEGTSVPKDDAFEAKAIHNTLGDVPVTALKSYFGDTGAGCGAIEIVAATLSLNHDLVPYTLNYETFDPECPINVIKQKNLEAKQDHILCLNQNHRGQTAALLISKE